MLNKWLPEDPTLLLYRVKLAETTFLPELSQTKLVNPQGLVLQLVLLVLDGFSVWQLLLKILTLVPLPGSVTQIKYLVLEERLTPGNVIVVCKGAAFAGTVTDDPITSATVPPTLIPKLLQAPQLYPPA